MKKEAESTPGAGIESLLVKPMRMLGSLGGVNAPWLFRKLGGPFTGSLIQELLGGTLGYGAGRLVNRLSGRDTKLPLMGALAGGALGVAPHALPLYSNYLQGAKRGGDNPLARAWYGLNPSVLNRQWTKGSSLLDKSAELSLTPPQEEMYNRKKAFRRRLTKQAGYYDPQRGYGIPISHTRGMIWSDPLLSPTDKAKAIAIIDDAADGRRSGILTWPNVARAAVGAGVGYAGGTVFAKLMDSMFGGLATKSQKRLQGAGVLAGILKGVGVL